MTGTLYGIGVGPGDPDLLTLKAHRLLRGAHVVAYPAPDEGESFARSIVSQFLTDDQMEIPIRVPMRTERFPAKAVYDKAAETIAATLDRGDDVVVLCEGDAFFYGSFMYLFERLADAYPCEIVPGVSSLMAAGAALKRPLAARNDRLIVLPAPLPDDALLDGLKSGDCVAIIKVGRHLKRICGLVEQVGRMDQAAYLERVTLENQKIMPLAGVGDGQAPYFSIILIYGGAEDWITNLPLPIEQSVEGIA